MLTLEDIKKLNNNLDLYVGRTIFALKNHCLEPIHDTKYVDEQLHKKQFSFGYLELPALWELINDAPSYDDYKNRLLSMLIDIKIYFVEVVNTEYLFILANNKEIKKQESHIVDELNRIRMHDLLSSTILKYRALWDKYMGCLVYVYFGEKEHKKWEGKKSHKTAFENLFKDKSLWKLIGLYIDGIKEFDDQYRTAEAHFTGRAKNKILLNESIPFKEQYLEKMVYEHFNTMLDFTKIFEEQLCEILSKKSSIVN